MRTESFVDDKPVDRLLQNMRCGKIMKSVMPDAVVCDLGCGEKGNFLKSVESKIRKGYGFDLSVDKKYETEKIKLAKVDLNKQIPLPDSSVDLVVSMAVLEHLNEPENFIKEISRILKSGGGVSLTTPTKFVDPVIKFLGFIGLINSEEVYDHKGYFNREKLTYLFEKYGFTDIKVETFQIIFNQIVTARKI